jgi:hypothetical protein
MTKENDRRTSNTMTKRKWQKDKQHNDQAKRKKGLATQWPKEKDRWTSNIMAKRKPSVLFFWSLCCLSFCPFLLVIVLLFLLPFYFGHCVASPSGIFFWSMAEGQATQ